MSSVVICPTCGHANDVDASFCVRDDTWLGGEHRRDDPGADGGDRSPGGPDDPSTAAPDGRPDQVGPVAATPVDTPPERLGAVDPRTVRARAAARRAPADAGDAGGAPSGPDESPRPSSTGPSDSSARGDGERLDRDRPDLTGPRCRACGRLAPAGATICACGEPLVAMAAAAPAARSARSSRDEGRMSRSAFARQQRRANSGRRPSFDRPLAGRVIWFRATALAVLALLVVGWMADVHLAIADAATGALARVVPGMVQRVDVESAQVAGDDDGDSLYAIDGTDLAWETPWDPAGAAPDAACGTAQGGAALLRVEFVGSTSISRVTVVPGLAEDDRGRALQHRPRRIDVVFDDGTCTQVPLPDDPGPVEVDLPVRTGATLGATIAIVDTWPAPDGGEDVVAVRELSFGRS